MSELLRVKTATALVAALLLVLAGCAGGAGPGTDDGGTVGETPTPDGTPTSDDAQTANDAETDADDGSTDDDQTDADDQTDDSQADGDGQTDDVEESALEPSTGGTAGEAGTVKMYLSDSPIEEFEHLNVTISRVGLKRAEGANGSGDGGWVEYEVENTTADLTELQGPNATSLGVLSAPAGNYTKVFVYVDEVEGILNDGEEVNVKLPSQKLQITSAFTVSANSSVDFVFDISVSRAGNSGKYILQPVVSESGTGDDVEIRDVDEEDEEDDEDGEDDEEEENETDDEEEDDGDDGTDDADGDGDADDDGDDGDDGDEGGETGGEDDEETEQDGDETDEDDARLAPVTQFRTPV